MQQPIQPKSLIARANSWVNRAAIAVGILVFILVVPVGDAQPLTVLHSFTGLAMGLCSNSRRKTEAGSKGRSRRGDHPVGQFSAPPTRVCSTWPSGVNTVMSASAPACNIPLRCSKPNTRAGFKEAMRRLS